MRRTRLILASGSSVDCCERVVSPHISDWRTATSAQRTYNSIFPYSVEVCAVTQLHKKGSKPGGWGGHATLFLTGTEIDASRGYPQIRLTPDRADLSDPGTGVGISVNKIFDNVAWVAIPGRAEFFRGNLEPSATLDDQFHEAAVQRAASAGWFAGIEIKADLARERPASMSMPEFIVRHSIGTDFAIGFARTAYSALLPVSRDAMSKALAYLNEVNNAAHRSGYRWNMYTNNCSHIVHNAVAAAGVWDAKVARGPGAIDVAREVLSVARTLVMSRMSDFSFPANNFVRLYEAGNERPIDDVVAAYHNHDIRRTVDDGWLVTGPGALIASYPMHDPARNRVFGTGRDPFLFSVPVLWDKEHTFATLTRAPSSEVTDLGANLAHYRERYLNTLSTRRAVDDLAGSLTAADEEEEFRAFHGRFYQLIEQELARTEARIRHVS